MPFRIIGEEAVGQRTARRALAASAAVLAMKWMHDGVQDVTIEADGRTYDVNAFRAQFMPSLFAGLRSQLE